MTDPILEVSRRLYEVLGRQGIPLDHEALHTAFAGKRILVTGAAGSIGTALSTLLAGTAPESLTLLDVHENSLFHLRQQLAVSHPDAPLRYVLADVRNRARIGRVFDTAAPEIIFHLAAYKHVPFAEDLPEEFAAVNVLGTWGLLQEARRAGVRKLIYPSTDKAVNPPSIYGATKRSVELLLQAAAPYYPELTIAAVRLVNVLGARGGVVETFARQIAAGLPVTITDRRMTRYWITMDEALHLLTSAAMLSYSGAIYLLDLGDPITVADVADRLWAMLQPPGTTMPVEYTGCRPGERLAEELAYADERLVPSGCVGVMRVQGGYQNALSLAEATDWLAALDGLVQRSADPELRHMLFDFIRVGVGV